MQKNAHLSFEFFPPKTERGFDKLMDVSKSFTECNPEFFSVTFGAAGSTQEKTTETVFALKQILKMDVAPHLSCVGSSKENIEKIILNYKDKGIKRIVALRGDHPSGMGGVSGDFHYAYELVNFIRELTGDTFKVEVAAYPEFHPEAHNSLADVENLKRKVEAGASSAITQYFYNVDAYFRFVDDCDYLDINVPIVPGVMPIHNVEKLIRFSKMCGAEIPLWLLKRLDLYKGDEASIRAFGIDVITELCDRLLNGGAPGLHFYTLNQLEPTLKICKNVLTLENNQQCKRHIE